MGRIFLVAILMTVVGIPQLSFAQPSLSSEIAPTGKLRVAMNGGNPVLLRRASDGKMVGGVAFEVGKFVADKLGITFELVAYANADTYTQSFGKGEWDIGFGTPAPLVVDKADFVWIWCWRTLRSSPRRTGNLPMLRKSIGPESRSGLGKILSQISSSAAI